VGLYILAVLPVMPPECPTPEDLRYCDTPQKAADYWRLHIEGHPFFDRERECFVVIVLNTKLRARGHQFVSVGTSTSVPCILEKCSGSQSSVPPTRSCSCTTTRAANPNRQRGSGDHEAAFEAAAILGIGVTDHVITGHRRHCSLREMGLL